MAHPPIVTENDVEIHSTHHIVPVSTYLAVFFALMVLLVLTLAAAAVELGPLNVFVAMAIAVAKAALVVMYFMHVKYSSRLVQVFAGSAFVWLLILFMLTFSDYFTRNWVAVPGQ